ncbi:XPG domain containing-domain-containing protein [Annulohypoxylon bovei var. microspora]|nr:XPG domain containing-domain-containing protein [Annulohypoxylon bovei var. microspora]
MGIRGLNAALQRYGVVSPLSGDTVVIDGPALVHRIGDACMRKRPSSSGFMCHPPYALLSAMVIGWLKRLKSYDVNVRRIYFDGYLPPSKWDVRRGRLLNQQKILKGLAISNPSGSAITPGNAFSDLEPSIAMTEHVSWATSNRLAKPPFLIPAVLEALKNSEDWGPLVLVVPGEADMFCAQDVRENGGTLLTSDSDLLIQDIGIEGTVTFFWNIRRTHHISNKSGLMATKLSLHDINTRLDLGRHGGLPRVAFEMGNQLCDDFDMALHVSRSSHEDVLNSPEYKSFMENLELRQYVPIDHPVLGILSSLDPRISEVVIQTLLLEKTSSTSDMKELRGPKTLSIFLPVLIENEDQKSAWTPSTNVRQLAYSTLETLARRKINGIIEYHARNPSVTQMGRQTEIPSGQETISNCNQLLAVLETLSMNISPIDLRWLAFAVYQDIVWSTSEQRVSLSAMLVDQAARQPEDPQKYSWDLIHFTAQVQACFYSLRIEKQILDAVIFMDQDLPAPARQLHNYLASLPPIAEWPTVERMSALLTRFATIGGLAKVADMLGITEPEMEKLLGDSKKQPRKRRKQGEKLWHHKKHPNHQSNIKRSSSVNPYAILTQMEQH